MLSAKIKEAERYFRASADGGKNLDENTLYFYGYWMGLLDHAKIEGNDDQPYGIGYDDGSSDRATLSGTTKV